MLSTNEITTLRSYHQKKFRDEVGVLIAETPKVVNTLLAAGIEPIGVYVVSEAAGGWKNVPTIEVSEKELSRISDLVTPHEVFAVFKNPNKEISKNSHIQGKSVSSHRSVLSVREDGEKCYNAKDGVFKCLLKGVSLVLDDIRDPGNMGTILRLADWFGIDRIIASESSADVFQPKCVQASMGSVGNVPVFYGHLPSLMASLPKEFPIYGTFMDGENIYDKAFERENAWFVVGNEAHGISADVATLIKQRISIPSFESATGRKGVAESLNAAMATAVICSEVRRKG